MNTNRMQKIAAVATAAAFLLTAALAIPQGPPPAPEQVERLNRAPVSKDILRVKIPRAHETVLENGLTVMILEDHRFPVVTMSLQVSGSGPLFDPKDMPGLASVTAQMLREGTKTRNARAITEEVDRLGATLNAGAGFGSYNTVLNASGLSDNFDEWFALASDILLLPSFPADELGRLKQRLTAQLRQQRGNPGFLVSERFYRAVYGQHPAAVRAHTPEALQAMTPEIIARWHAERYAPQNSILAFAGDVTPAVLLPKLNTLLAGWKKSAASDALSGSLSPVAARKVLIVDRPTAVQTDIWLGNIAIDRRNPDYMAMVVMDQVVGGSNFSRLFTNLRERKGYTYGANSNLVAVKYAGPWFAGSSVRTEVTEGAMTEFLNEINRIRDEKVSASELDDAKRSLVANFALSLEQPAQLLNFSLLRKVYGLPENAWDLYPAEIMAVTADDVQRVARKYLNPETLQIVAVGDASKIKAVMEKYGAVEMFDANGKPITAAASASK